MRAGAVARGNPVSTRGPGTEQGSVMGTPGAPGQRKDRGMSLPAARDTRPRHEGERVEGNDPGGQKEREGASGGDDHAVTPGVGREPQSARTLGMTR